MTTPKNNTCTFCATGSHILRYDGYELAYILRRHNNKDIAALQTDGIYNIIDIKTSATLTIVSIAYHL
jgi:hypothetical protein